VPLRPDDYVSLKRKAYIVRKVRANQVFNLPFGDGLTQRVNLVTVSLCHLARQPVKFTCA
jgi:hypothetical protein